VEGYVQGAFVRGSPCKGVQSRFDYYQISCVIWDLVS